MNPIVKIGRWEIPIESVIGIKRRSGLRGWLQPGFDVILWNGQKILFTNEEKWTYDEEMELHKRTLQVWGMCKSLGLRS